MAECGDITPPDVAAHCDATEPEPKVGLDIGGHGFRPGSDLLESYLAKYRETTARDSLSAMPSEARIISRAAVSNTPFFPQKLPIVAHCRRGGAVHRGRLDHHAGAADRQSLSRRCRLWRRNGARSRPGARTRS